MLKKCLYGLTFLIIVFLVGAALLYQKVQTFANANKVISEDTVIHLQAGQSAHTVFQALESIEKTSLNRLYFKLWLRLYPENAQVKAGYYRFEANSDETNADANGDKQISLSEVFDTIRNGDESQFSITLVEGLTLKEWLSLIENTDTLTQDIPKQDALYSRLVEQSGGTSESFCVNELRIIEGCLLANTYFYRYQDSAMSIIERAYQEMGKTLQETWSQRFKDIPIARPYEALILASIIEKETAVASERGTIAGVFSNRLELNMRLQTDPTVIYGIGDEFDGNITRKHLREYTPYNTYRIKGLPPTPIAMAGREALIAAVNPDITDYIYFVSKGNGTHQFSVSLAEHNAAVAKYQLNR